jgi:pimeloyl-ACP methyl ester carboxylesterase
MATRLGQINIPTLVITGRDDRLVPPENSHMLAERISAAILKEIPGGHQFMEEYPEEFNRVVIEFIRAHP